MSVVVAIYTLRIMADESKTDDENQAVADGDELGGVLSDTEDRISDVLPEGYYAKIEDH